MSYCITIENYCNNHEQDELLDHSTKINTIFNNISDTNYNQELEQNNSEDEETEQQSLNNQLLDAVEFSNNLEVERLLNEGADANATCQESCISACHLAALLNGEALRLLLKAGADAQRVDFYGSIPLHYAAYSGDAKSVAILLGVSDGSDDLQVSISNVTKDKKSATQELRSTVDDVINVPIARDGSQVIPDNWKDGVKHDCNRSMGKIPWLSEGSSPLHVASFAGHHHCVTLLLLSGAVANLKDLNGRTALDVAGSAIYRDYKVDKDDFLQTVKVLLQNGVGLNTYIGTNVFFDSVLHTAVKLLSSEAIPLLLNAGAAVCNLSRYGYTPLHDCVEAKLEDHLKIFINYPYSHLNGSFRPIEVRNYEGSTILHMAARAGWATGVSLALEAGIDVTITDHFGDTALHCAAESGDLDIFLEILYVTKNTSCSLKQRNKRDFTPFSIAIQTENMDLITHMLYYDEDLNDLIHEPSFDGTFLDKITPLEFAVVVGNEEIFELLFEREAYITDEILCRLVNVMSKYNRDNLFHKLLSYVDGYMTKDMRSLFFQKAVLNGNVNMIRILFSSGIDLSQRNENGQSVMSLLMHYDTRQEEFLESLFDMYIYSNSNNIHDNYYTITVDYCVLISEDPIQQINILEVFLETSHKKGQRQFLAHPLLESFLYVMWKKLRSLIYLIITIHALLLLSVNGYCITVFYHKDREIDLDNISSLYYPKFWQYFAFLSAFLFCIQEVLIFNPIHWHYAITNWLKLGSLILGIATPILVTMDSPDSEWRRHMATTTVVILWLDVIIFMSSTPSWGYFMHMFFKVAFKVIKIILSFSFLVICFSIIFMIQFHTTKPFESPLAAVIKTTVMMTSEFEYENLFDKNITTSLAVLRITFLTFLVLIPIVLMNLMIGVAVNDLNSLTYKGKLRRLEKQLSCLCMLKAFINTRLWIAFWIDTSNTRIVPKFVELRPNINDWYIFEGHLRKNIFQKAQINVKDDTIQQKENEELIEERKKNDGEKISSSEVNLESVAQRAVSQILTGSGFMATLTELMSKKNEKGYSNDALLELHNKSIESDGISEELPNIHKNNSVNNISTVPELIENNNTVLTQANIYKGESMIPVESSRDVQNTHFQSQNDLKYNHLNSLVEKNLQKTDKLEKALVDMKNDITTTNQMLTAVLEKLNNLN